MALVFTKPNIQNSALQWHVINILATRGSAKIIAHRSCIPPREILERHYQHLQQKPFYHELLDDLQRQSMTIAVLAACQPVSHASFLAHLRCLVGHTDPAHAAPGTLRQRFGADIGNNALHCSDSPAAARAEIRLWRPIVCLE